MMMDLSRLQRFSLNSILLVSVLFASSYALKAESTNTAKDEAIIEQISYKYELANNSILDKLDCVGVLELYVTTPSNVEVVVLERTLPQVIHGIYRPKVKTAYTVNDITTIVTSSKVRWGTDFRLLFHLTDGTVKSSDMYYVNDFISEDDLALLRQSAALESVEHDEVNLTVDNRVLHVDTSEATQLSVFDISGKTVFNGEILQSTTIPLDHIASPFIFVRYTTANDTAIKKLLLR